MKRVALYMDHGCRGVGAARWAELLSNDPEIEFAMLDAADVRDGRLAGFDCLVMPGGGFERYEDWGEEGCAKIREFVHDGGGYIGHFVERNHSVYFCILPRRFFMRHVRELPLIARTLLA